MDIVSVWYQSLIVFIQERSGLVNYSYQNLSSLSILKYSIVKIAAICGKERGKASSIAGVGGPGVRGKLIVHRKSDQCGGRGG